MYRRYKLKPGMENALPHLLPEIEIVESVELETRSIQHDTKPEAEKKTTMFDKNGKMYRKDFLDIYYNEIVQDEKCQLL